MTFGIGYGPEVFDAYVTPDASTFYGDDDDGDDDEEPASSTAVDPAFDGIAGKFVNLSPRRVLVHWDPGTGAEEGSLLASCGPFQAVGTATYPGHRFYLTSEYDTDTELFAIDVEVGVTVYYYDPLDVPGDEARTRSNLEGLTLAEYERYESQRRNRLFADVYRDFTGRDYLARYPRGGPVHHLWPAERFGQVHWVTTAETHFVATPPEEEMGRIEARGKERALPDGSPRLLPEYRDPDATMLNLTLTALSCAPRVFEVPDFLSAVEIDHVLRLATGADMRPSATSAGDEDAADPEIDSTRTSYNAWLERERSPVVDAIYRRAADLLRIDEALLRRRDDDEYPQLKTRMSIAESLQLVHYDVGQEYTAHHDFGYGDVDDADQRERYATLLLYLNEGMGGGETQFPRWVNAETGEALSVTPERGKAVLFYSQLPDGNMDDLSQHAALPVTRGEKWLMNLWVHDPYYE